MSLPHCILMLMLFLSLSPVGCSCSFFSLCHISCLKFSYPYMLHSLPGPFFHPRHDNFNALKFQLIPDTWIWWFLEAIGSLTLSGIVPDEKPFSQFSFPFSGAWGILPSSNYGFPIVRWKFLVSISFFVLILRSQMSPHVMYSSAGCVIKSWVV